MCVCCPGKPEEDFGFSGTGVQMVVNGHVGAMTKPRTSGRASAPDH